MFDTPGLYDDAHDTHTIFFFSLLFLPPFGGFERLGLSRPHRVRVFPSSSFLDRYRGYDFSPFCKICLPFMPSLSSCRSYLTLLLLFERTLPVRFFLNGIGSHLSPYYNLSDSLFPSEACHLFHRAVLLSFHTRRKVSLLNAEKAPLMVAFFPFLRKNAGAAWQRRCGPSPPPCCGAFFSSQLTVRVV